MEIDMAGTQITVTLPPELEAFIEERVAAGRFATAGEAVREGLQIVRVLHGRRDVKRLLDG
jgi:putative addiction module CopG family antidote